MKAAYLAGCLILGLTFLDDWEVRQVYPRFYNLATKVFMNKVKILGHIKLTVSKRGEIIIPDTALLYSSSGYTFYKCLLKYQECVFDKMEGKVRLTRSNWCQWLLKSWFTCNTLVLDMSSVMAVRVLPTQTRSAPPLLSLVTNLNLKQWFSCSHS